MHEGRDLGLRHRQQGVVEAGREVHGEVEGARVAVVGIDLEAAVEHRPQRPGDRLEAAAVELPLADVEQHRHLVGSRAEGLHEQHLGEDDAEREEVGAPVDLLGVSRLGAQVADLALDDAVLRVLLAVARTGDPEVGELHLAVVGDQDVARADVAVDDLLRLAVGRAELVREVEAGADLEHDPRREPPRTAPLEVDEALEHPEEVAAGHVLHRDVGQPVGLAEVVDLDHVGVHQARGDLGLVGEHAQEARPLQEVGVDALDGHRLGEAADAHHLGAVDVRHAP